jgi:uncharacterized glyoxalase superfamily protein PhnB
MTSREVSSSVEVAADPATAFMAFTEEIALWWVQGPINFYDSSRAYGKRIEPGVGGRILEVYDRASGEGLELARITVWEPGVRLGWQSSLDDVATEVRFGPTDAGTLVSVRATIPEDGADRGGTAWVRMTPVWFGAWCAKRDRAPRQPLPLGRLALGVQYAKKATAAVWLRDVFGFEPAGNIPETDAEATHAWIEFHVGNCCVMLFTRPADGRETATPVHTPWVFVDDLDAHLAHAKARGAEILEEIQQHGYRFYEAADVEGNRWIFAQAGPLMMEV